MPIELNDLISDECWVDVTWRGEDLRVAYHPAAMSLTNQIERQKRIEALDSATDADATSIHFVQIFCELVCAWDVTMDGEALPVTAEYVARLPMSLIRAIMAAIGEDANSGQEEKKVLSATSAATSSPTGKRVKSPNGIRTSEPPSTWA